MLLADEFRHQTASFMRETMEGRYEPLAAEIAKAQKFVLDEDFARLADSMRHEEVLRVLEHCRPPYPVTWLEFSHNHRPRFRDGNPPSGIQRVPDRIGALVRTRTTDHTLFDVQLFWRFPEAARKGVTDQFGAEERDIVVHSSGALAIISLPDQITGKDNKWETGGISVKESSLPGAEELSRHVRLVPGPLFAATEDYTYESVGYITQVATKDWSGEPLFFLTVFALMNTKNLAQSEPAEIAKLNRARIKRGTTPFSEHHVLKVRVTSPVRKIEGEGRRVGDKRRAHLVKGHFKQRKSGLFWWNPHVAGRGPGFAHKTYRVAK